MDDINHRQASDKASDDVNASKTQPATGKESAVRTFHLDHTGLRRILGTLEADLLEAVWRLTPTTDSAERGWTTIGAVCEHLGAGYHYKTVQTVMNRLVEKQLLQRQQHGRAFEYRATMTRDELVAQVTRNVVSGLVRDFGDVAIAQLVQTLHEITPDHLALLEELAAAPSAPSLPTAESYADEQRNQTGAAHTGAASAPGGASRQEPSSKKR